MSAKIISAITSNVAPGNKRNEPFNSSFYIVKLDSDPRVFGCSCPTGTIALVDNGGNVTMLVKTGEDDLSWELTESSAETAQVSIGSFPISAEDTIQERWIAPYDLTIIGVRGMPEGSETPASASSDNTLSVTNVTESNEILSAATVSIDGGTLYTPVSLTLNSTSENLNLSEGDVVEFEVVCPSDATGDHYRVDILFRRR